MLQQAQPDDFVIATGEQHTVSEFVDVAAEEAGMKIEWRGNGVDEEGFDEKGRRVVAVNPRYFRLTEVNSLIGDASKARIKLGWKPRTTFREMVREMVASDLRKVEQDRTIRRITGCRIGTNRFTPKVER